MKKGLFFICLFIVKNAIAQTSSFPAYDKDLLSADFFKSRREALREKLPDSSMCILFSAQEKNSSSNYDYTFHQDANFYYLTGITEANSILLLYKSDCDIAGKQVHEILFVPEKNEKQEVWNGKKPTFSDVSKISGVSTVMFNSEFKNQSALFSNLNWILRLPFPKGMIDSKKDEQDLFSLVEQFKLNVGFPSRSDDDFKLRKMLEELREIKQEQEIKLIRKAVTISCKAHLEMMRALEPGFPEYKIQAIGEYVFKSEGAETTGYPSICGSGENSCILHYETNRKTILNNELILLDMGAEYHGYSADITRTLPVNGKFSIEQRQIYDLVYNAQVAAIMECKTGNSFRTPHEKAFQIISDGLMELGILKEPEKASSYFMHGTSHYLGLDVHDIGSYSNLKPGNIITVEPGIYIPEGSPCDPKWWNIGVRIEDDVLITKDGYEVLSADLPSKWQDIEKVMAEKSFFNK